MIYAKLATQQFRKNSNSNLNKPAHSCQFGNTANAEAKSMRIKKCGKVAYARNN